MTVPPDLQLLVDRAGRRHAAEIGEEYVEDPFKRPPDQGGYTCIIAAEWIEFDRREAGHEWRRLPREPLTQRDAIQMV
jgi:hypothetical protein